MRKIATVAALVVVLSTSISANAGSLGSCRMRLTERRNSITVRYVLLTPRVARQWRLRVLDDGVAVFRKTYVTDENGDFRARARIDRRRGVRRYDGIAVDVVTRDRCHITLRS